MTITMILEMAVSAGDRTAVTSGGRSLTAARLLELAGAAALRFRGRPAVLYTGANHLAYPVALFGAAIAGVPFVPLNYRLGERQLTELKARHPGALVLDPGDLDALLDPPDDAASAAGAGASGDVSVAGELPPPPDPDDVAVLLYTSGTTAAPKSAVLRHRHLLAYVLNTLEFASAAETDAALVAVPPYHIAGLANLLTNIYTGRRVVYMESFDAAGWLETVRREGITHALLVPTMLARIVAAVDGDDARTPTLATLAYGGARTPRPVLEKALRVFPGTGFVNAYGLTETASSVAVLGPNDHRKALASDDPQVRARLGSVGRALPGVEFQIRTEKGELVPAGETGLVWVRGDQISGEYGERTVLDAGGWFATRDRGRLDAGGYLFIEGRADDTIIRGGENIAPAEIEDVLLDHPGVTEAAVIGVPDPEWGQRIVAVLVGRGDPEEIRAWARERLRSSKTPDAVVFRDALPKTETGKLLRRVLLAEMESAHA
ncbi:class I adenylate-forming enzyme family protein [Actinomadura parmotrematis]|uniref:Fatty acid--CoA ligase family protein n=1 Tax=Actinomadura parmotrematis TaxID=2864039 RepID=A0ABS7FQJ2_9ACTN|nr:fatty acid--CoA ligase family protein [Actinomadura parmotrematis]MBW8482659.1 fatty acid--CoA ligase family protein [Actinomadura parmotrematis]